MWVWVWVFGVCARVYVCDMPQCTHGDEGTSFRGHFSPLTWGLEIELGCSDFTASIFTRQLISLAPIYAFAFVLFNRQFFTYP